jgi:hypothetical protein
VVISPKMMTTPVLQIVSHATRDDGSRVRQASTTASEIVSQSLSGWDSVTPSDVNRNEDESAEVPRVVVPASGEAAAGEGESVSTIGASVSGVVASAAGVGVVPTLPVVDMVDKIMEKMVLFFITPL